MVDVTPELQSVRAASVPEVLTMLRSATGAQHRALEARLPFLRADFDLVTYRRLIQAYYGFHLTLEQRVEAFDSGLFKLTERQKTPALTKDLRALGLSADAIEALPVCADLPLIDSTAHLLGTMYVMEGATLGGQVLRRIVADKLAIDADTGGEFLDVYGRDTGRLWKAFLKRLAEFDHPAHNLQVVDAACSTFSCFERWLERAGVLHDAR